MAIWYPGAVGFFLGGADFKRIAISVSSLLRMDTYSQLLPVQDISHMLLHSHTNIGNQTFVLNTEEQAFVYVPW